MGIFNKKPRKNFQPSRKQQRKEKRKEKKLRKSQFFGKKKVPGQFVLNPDKNQSFSEATDLEEVEQSSASPTITNKMLEKSKTNKLPTTEEIRKKDFKEQKKLQKQMVKQRNIHLLDANKEEDRIIKQLEKQLGLKKRKSKALPKSFAEEGLDYLLEVCDPERMKHVVAAETELNDNDGFEEDFALMTGKSSKKSSKKNKQKHESDEEFSENDLSSSDYEDEEDNISEHDEDDISDDEDDISDDKDLSEDQGEEDFDEEIASFGEEEIGSLNDCEELNEDNFHEEIESERRKVKKRKKKSKEVKDTKKQKTEKEPVEDESDEVPDESDEVPEEYTNYSDDDFNSDDENIEGGTKKIKGAAKINEDGTWEDIYGRLRDKDGSILTGTEISKYIPPAARNRLSDDSKKIEDSEKIIKLKRQLKGLLNRLAESNMHSIANQIEELYMNNSRNDMNDTLTNLMLESLVAPIITPERLLIEHVLLVSILHANVGTEVGAHFLQTVIRKFDEYLETYRDVENKTLDNVVLVIAQLYNFKVFDSKLMYEILMKLAGSLDEKYIECILHVLRSVGFTLRKDDPIALKNLILDLQKKAVNVSDEDKGYSRVKFMLEILLAIKNNNVTKIPNYDVSYSEHLKKIMKTRIRKGNYVTQLNISLEDLLKADERGRWWVVGSAWSGNDQTTDNRDESGKRNVKYSVKLLELAKKQRMNTDTRRNIFCIIMSAEDYLDAFEKLVKLGLKNQQEREIINVILQCCLQEKKYNPYYAHLAQKFCDYDRKYQMIIKYSVWDKLKALNDHSGSQISNLAKMLIHLFIEKGLPISTLKIVQFSELDKISLRFMRQVLIGIILHEDLECCLAVFAKVSISDKLKMFRESLRLFIHHFLLKNLKTESIPDDQKALLDERAKAVEKVLAPKEFRI